MAKQKTGGQKKGTPNKITTDVRAEGTTRAAPAAAPSAGGLGPQYFGLRTMVLQERRTPVQCHNRSSVTNSANQHCCKPDQQADDF